MDTITKCSKAVQSIQERERESVLNRTISQIDSKAKNNRPIIENCDEESENVTSSDEGEKEHEEVKENIFTQQMASSQNK